METQSRKIGYYIKTDNNKFDFTINETDLDSEFYKELKDNTQVLIKLQPIIIVYQALLFSFCDLDEFCKQTEKKYEDKYPICLNELILITMCRANQRVANILSSATSFLTIAENILKKEFGDISEITTNWNDSRRNFHKEHFCYRLLYELRNYSQHFTIPISRVNVNVDDMATNNNTASVNILLSSKELLKSKYKWKQLETELKNHDIEIDLVALIEEYKLVLKNIFINFVRCYNDELLICSHYLSTLSNIMTWPEGAEPVVFISEPHPNIPFPSNVEHIPYRQLSWLLNMIK